MWRSYFVEHWGNVWCFFVFFCFFYHSRKSIKKVCVMSHDHDGPPVWKLTQPLPGCGGASGNYALDSNGANSRGQSTSCASSSWWQLALHSGAQLRLVAEEQRRTPRLGDDGKEKPKWARTDRETDLPASHNNEMSFVLWNDAEEIPFVFGLWCSFVLTQYAKECQTCIPHCF